MTRHFAHFAAATWRLSVGRRSAPSAARIALAVAILLATATTSFAQRPWIPVDLGALPELGDYSQPTAINNRGDVVGHSGIGRRHAFLWTAEHGMRDLNPTMAGSQSEAHDVNEARQVVGWFQARDGNLAGPFRAVLWTETGDMIELGTLGESSIARAINNAGQVLGTSFVSGEQHWFLWTASTGMVDLTARYGVTGATDLNDAGQIVGGQNFRDYVWTLAGGFVDLGVEQNRVHGTAPHINNAGQIAGARAVGDPTVSPLNGATIQPFVWSATHGLVDIAAPQATEVVGFSDAGDLAMWSPYIAGQPHSLARSPAYSPLESVGGTIRAISNAGPVGSYAFSSHAIYWCRGNAPAITGVSATPSTLTPADGRMVTVRVNYAATAHCGGTTSGSLSVSANEALADGDAVVVDANTVQLRARSTSGSGRTYVIRIRVLDEHGWPGTRDVSVAVNPDQGGAMTGVTLTATPQAGNTVLLTAAGSGGTPPYLYRFWIERWGGQWQLGRDWDASPTFTWPPTETGGYNVWVQARRSSSTGTDPEVQAGINYTVTAVGGGGGGGGGGGPMTGVTLSTNLASPQPGGATVVLTAAGSGGTGPYVYRFWVQPWNGDWQLVRDWNAAATHAWTPTIAGGYNVWVQARRSAAPGTDSEVQAGINFVVSSSGGGAEAAGAAGR